MRVNQSLLFAVILCCVAIACGVALTMQMSDSPPDDRGTVWIAAVEDNICGRSDLRAVVNPARVDYDRLLRATPEMRRIERENIDVKSAIGVILHAAAVDRVRGACDVVRSAMSHCSVWKAIRRADGRPIVDRTEEVLGVIRKSVATTPEPARGQ